MKRPAPSSEDGAPSNEEQPTTPPETKKLKKSEVEKKFYADEVAFELNLDEGYTFIHCFTNHCSEKEEMLKKLDKPFIRTSAKVTILHLKKYLKKKLDASVKDVRCILILFHFLGGNYISW